MEKELQEYMEKECSDLFNAKERADEYKMIIYAFADLIFILKMNFLTATNSKSNDRMFDLLERIIPNKEESEQKAKKEK